MVWTRPLAEGIQEGTPLVHDGVMFFPNPNDLTQAIDGDTGDLLWEYRASCRTALKDYIPIPAINRNLAIYGNFIIDTGTDNYVYALDARTGKLAWETPVLDSEDARAHHRRTDHRERQGDHRPQCQPEAGRDSCVVTAHDAKTGKELWRIHTIPRTGEPGDETWGDVPMEQRWHVGTWMVPSYDPELNLIYIGTSVTIPAPKFMLAGNDKQHLYHNCTLALNADTGKIVWYYQHIVDHWDLDHPFERMLVDTVVAPDPREVHVDQSEGAAPASGARSSPAFPARPASSTRSIGRPASFSGRGRPWQQNVDQHDRRATGKVMRQSESVHDAERGRALRLPGQQRRQELAGRRLQPAHQH